MKLTLYTLIRLHDCISIWIYIGRTSLSLLRMFNFFLDL
jgi:hypothetical protein